MKIGVDLDGVVVDIAPILLTHLSEITGRNIKIEDIFCYDFSIALGLSSHQLDELWSRIKSEDLFLKAFPFSGSVDYLKNKRNLIEWHFVTSRPIWAREVTIDWLKKYDLHTIPITFTEHGKVIASEMNFSYFLEDDLYTAKILSQRGLPVLLFDHPWNREEEPPHPSRRVKGWEEVAHIINSTLHFKKI